MDNYSRGLWFDLNDEETSDHRGSNVWVLFLITFLLVVKFAYETPLMP